MNSRLLHRILSSVHYRRTRPSRTIIRAIDPPSAMTSSKNGGEEFGIKNIYDLIRWVYCATGTWRVDSPKKIERIAYRAYKTFTYAAYFIYLASIYFGVALISGNLQMFCFSLTYFLISNVGVTKLILLEFQIWKLKNLENRLDRDFDLPWMGKFDWEKEVKKKNSAIVTLLAKWLLYTAGFGTLATIFPPIFPNSKLVFVIPTPYDHLEKTPFFIPIYMSQAFSLMNFITSFTAHDLMFVGFIMRLCDNLEIIKLNLKRIGVTTMKNGWTQSDWEPGFEADFRRKFYEEVLREKRSERENYAKIIKNCIVHHQLVFREIKLLGKVYSFITFMYVCGGPLLMGLLAYVILSGTAAMDILFQQACYAVPAGMFLFMQCYFGTQLSNHCEEVRFAFYDCPWYDMDVNTQKLIVTALITMEKTGKLRAGNLLDVALTSFLWSVKMSYNIVTFLKNTS